MVYDIHYGSGDVYGYNSHDTVCINRENCAQEFSFLNVGMQQGLYSLKASGIVGMSPTDANENGDLFIVKMRDSGVIEKAEFSLFINLEENNSSIQFGGYDLNKYALPGSSMTFHEIEDNADHWQLTLDSMSLVGVNDFSVGEGRKIIVDSGTSFLLMPERDRKAFIQYLSQHLFCMEATLPFCYCDEHQYQSFKDIRLTIDSKNYFLPKENYVMKDSNICAIGVMSHPLMDFWILGLNFFQNYYTIFDQENR